MKKQDNVTKTIKIYYLHKGDNIPFYVGKTKNRLKKRIYGHIKKCGNDTQIEELDIIDEKDWRFWECYWIEQFRQWGFDLLNKNRGGGGLEFHSPQTKNKISNMWKLKSVEEKTHINIKRGKGNIGKKKPTAGYRNWKEKDLNRLKNNSPFTKDDWSDRCKKQVLMLDKNTKKILKKFNSVTEAALSIGVAQGTLSGCLIGRSKTSGGYIWKYKE